MKKLLDRMEKIFDSNWCLLTTIIIMAVGLFLCHRSFDSSYQILQSPLLNLWGILLLVIPPWQAALFYCLRGKAGKAGIEIKDSIFPAYLSCFAVGWVTAFLYSSSYGFLAGATVVAIGIAGLTVLGLVQFFVSCYHDISRDELP